MSSARRIKESVLLYKRPPPADVAIITIMKPSQHLRPNHKADPAEAGRLKKEKKKGFSTHGSILH